jgi:CheY-like chemotaxis protein
VQVGDAAEALRKLEADDRFDLMLTDIVMPGGSQPMIRSKRRSGKSSPLGRRKGRAWPGRHAA